MPIRYVVAEWILQRHEDGINGVDQPTYTFVLTTLNVPIALRSYVVGQDAYCSPA